MTQGKTKSGIGFQFDERILKDYRFIRLINKISSSIEPTEQMSAIDELFKTLFGSEEALDIFIDAVAKHNDGICGVDVLMKEIKDMIGSVNGKKSSSSQVC